MTGDILIRGNLSARRPGRATRKQPLPAERQRRGAISNYQPLTRVSRLSADTAGRREVVTDRIRVRRGPAFGGIWKNTRLLNPARTKFTPAVKAAGHLSGSSLVHLRQQDCGGEAPVNHVDSSMSVAPAYELQSATGVVGNVRKAFGEIRNVEC